MVPTADTRPRDHPAWAIPGQWAIPAVWAIPRQQGCIRHVVWVIRSEAVHCQGKAPTAATMCQPRPFAQASEFGWDLPVVHAIL